MSGHVGRSPFLNWYFIEKTNGFTDPDISCFRPPCSTKGKHRFLCSNKNTFGWFRNVSHLLRCQSTKVGRTSFFPKSYTCQMLQEFTKMLQEKSWRFGSDHVPFFSWVIVGFQLLIFQGVYYHSNFQQLLGRTTPSTTNLAFSSAKSGRSWVE